MSVETQLNAPQDVASAHQFFATQNPASLPAVDVTGGAGSGSALLQALRQPASFLPAFDQATSSFVGGFKEPSAMLGALKAPGAETALAAVHPTGAEAALAGMPAPGAEQVSPLVQLILKMPGLTGIIDSFFSFLGALFHGNILQAFDPILWMQQASGALSHLGPAALEHFPVSINLLPANAPFLQFLADGSANFLSPGGLQNIMQLHSTAGSVAQGMPNVNVSGPVNMQKPLFEAAPSAEFQRSFYTQDGTWSHFGRPHDVAVNPEIPSYRPTMGGAYQPSFQAQTPQTAPTQTPSAQPQTSSHAAHSNHAAQHAKAHHAPAHRASHHHESPVQHTDNTANAGSDSMIAQNTPTDAAGADYTIQPGDTLWDIARRNLGDGTRWHELYQANADVIGGNPDLIHPGTTLHMPSGGGELTAAGKYIVQPGDNLWSIAQRHMGGGENWGQIYSANQGVIGGNPRLIFPGQELDLGGAQGMTASSGSPSIPTAADSSAAASAQSSLSAQSQGYSAPQAAPSPSPSPQPEAQGSPAATPDGGIVNSTGVPAYSSPGVAPDGQSQAGNQQNYQ